MILKLNTWIRWVLYILLFASGGSLIAISLIIFPSVKLESLLRLFCKLCIICFGVRIKVTGEKNIPFSGSVITFNHNSFLDHFVVVGYLKSLMFGVEKASNHKIPMYGFISKKWGNIGIDRGNRSQSVKALEDLKVRLKNGGNLIIAPEGTRKPVGPLKPFKKGTFYFATQMDAPIIPITLIGMPRYNPDGIFYVHPGKTVTMHIGKKIETKGKTLEEVLEETKEYYENKIEELDSNKSGQTPVF